MVRDPIVSFAPLPEGKRRDDWTQTIPFHRGVGVEIRPVETRDPVTTPDASKWTRDPEEHMEDTGGHPNTCQEKDAVHRVHERVHRASTGAWGG